MRDPSTQCAKNHMLTKDDIMTFSKQTVSWSYTNTFSCVENCAMHIFCALSPVCCLNIPDILY